MSIKYKEFDDRVNQMINFTSLLYFNPDNMSSNSLFQVDLNGVLKVLSDSLYSSYQVFMRELLQNAVDAINARKHLGDTFTPAVTVNFMVSGGIRTISVEDNGVGLTLAEVDEFLSRIGSSSKSNRQDRESFIGQFGIGLLSCFMISDEVIVISKSAKNEEAVKWIGNINGTYQKMNIEEQIQVGTSVYLRVKDAIKLDEDLLQSLLGRYGTYLNLPIRCLVNDEVKNNFQRDFPWKVSAEEVIAVGRRTFKEEFQRYIPLKDRSGKTTGVAYIIPRTTHAITNNAHTVYIKNMFITDHCTTILPEWAFFVRAMINSGNISPTASREEIYKNQVLEDVREDLGECIKQFLVRLSETDPVFLHRLIGTHGTALKSLALNDEKFFHFISKWFRFPTSEGLLTLEEIKQQTKMILYVPDLDQFKQLLPVARGNGQLIINSGYIYDTEIFNRLNEQDKTAIYQAIDVEFFGNILKDVSLEETDRYRDRLKQLQYHLDYFNCELEIKQFSPDSLPMIFYMSQQSLIERDVANIQQESDDLWSGITGAVFSFEQAYHSKLFLNLNNPTIQKLLNQTTGASDELFMETMYINSMLLGHYPLNKKEMDIMNNNMEQLLNKIL